MENVLLAFQQALRDRQRDSCRQHVSPLLTFRSGLRRPWARRYLPLGACDVPEGTICLARAAWNRRAAVGFWVLLDGCTVTWPFWTCCNSDCKSVICCWSAACS